MNIKELVKLSKDISDQENINRQNILELLKTVEKIIRDVIKFEETVWVDIEIPGQYANMIFGWSVEKWTEPDLEYCIVVAQRNINIDPYTNEEIIWGDLVQKLLECSEVTQIAVCNKLDLLLNRIHRFMEEQYTNLKKTEQNIINKVIELQTLLDSTSESAMSQQQVDNQFPLPNPSKS